MDALTTPHKLPTPTVLMNEAIKRISLQRQSKKIFVMWPSLKQITTRFCHYTTQLIESHDGECLIDASIQSAFIAFEAETSPVESKKARAFVLGLTSHASQLITTSIMGKRGRNYIAWMPFREPIGEWMQKVNVNTLVTTPKKQEVSSIHAQALLIGNIVTYEEMQSFGIRLAVDLES